MTDRLTVDKRTVRVSLLVTPEVDASALAGIHGTLNSFAHVAPDPVSFITRTILPESLVPETKLSGRLIDNVMGMPLAVQCTLNEAEQTDVLVIPSLYLLEPIWRPDPYPDLTEWMIRRYAEGMSIYSACTGAMLLAETGLLNGYEATQHWAFEQLFRVHFPEVKLNINKALLTTGRNNRIVMSGASAAWHDLLIHLITTLASPQAAQLIAKFFLLQPHAEGQAPYVMFREHTDHDDAVIRTAQNRLREHFHETTPVDKTMRESGLSERTFKRRFRKATGYTPIGYVQGLRVERAKYLLETGSLPVDEIGRRVGYEDPTFFRRLFKRLTAMTPKAYRRKFQPIAPTASYAEPLLPQKDEV